MACEKVCGWSEWGNLISAAGRMWSENWFNLTGLNISVGWSTIWWSMIWLKVERVAHHCLSSQRRCWARARFKGGGWGCQLFSPPLLSSSACLAIPCSTSLVQALLEWPTVSSRYTHQGIWLTSPAEKMENELPKYTLSSPIEIFSSELQASAPIGA